MSSYEEHQQEDAAKHAKLTAISKLFHQLEGGKPCRFVQFTGSSETDAEALVECDGQMILVTARLVP